MRHRPWPIVLLACLHFFVPIANLAYGAWLLNASFLDFAPYYFKHTPITEIMSTFCLPWAAGVCVYLLKEWSFALFHGIMLTILYQNYTLWRDYPGVFRLPFLVATYFFNIGIVSYFFLPAVRLSYLNRKVRWWESLPRYEVNAPAVVEIHSKRAKSKITNFSQGGAFITSREDLKKDAHIKLGFTLSGQSILISARVAHIKTVKPVGYGIEFEHTPTTKVAIRHMINTLVSEGARPTRYAERDIKNELMVWFMTLIKTGKGLVPEVPLPTQQAIPSNVIPFRAQQVRAKNHKHSKLVERRKKPRAKIKTLAQYKKKSKKKLKYAA